jgi:hypothetical protein
MSIPLDFTIDASTGEDIAYGIAELHQGSKTGINASCSYDAGDSASLTLWCDFQDLEVFITTILGENSVIPIDDINNRYSRFLPHKYPLSFTKNMWANRIVNIQGIPGQRTVDDVVVTYPRMNGLNLEYRYAAVQVEYQPVPWPMLTDAEVDRDKEWQRFTTVVKTPRLDYLQVATGTFKWITDQKPMNQSVPLREESMDYIVTFHRCPEAFLNPFDYIGYANSFNGFLAGHPQTPADGFPAQTMQLIGVGEVIRPVAFTDNLWFDYQFYFRNQPNGFHKTRRVIIGTPSSYNYTEFSLDGITPATPTRTPDPYDPTKGNDTRAVKLQDLEALFLPN